MCVLYWICFSGHIHVVKWFLAKVNYMLEEEEEEEELLKRVRRYVRNELLPLPCRKGWMEVTKMLVDQFKLEKKDVLYSHNGNLSGLAQACASGHVEVVDYICDKFQVTREEILDEWRLFDLALSHNQLNVVSWMRQRYHLEAGYDSFRKDITDRLFCSISFS